MPSTSDPPRSITASKTLSVALPGGGGTPLQATHGANAGPSCVVAHNSSGFRDRYVAGRLAIT